MEFRISLLKISCSKMRWSTSAFLALAATVAATPFKRAESLTVKVTPKSTTVDTVDDLRFTASISNVGSEPVKVLNYGTILDSKLPTKSFEITKDEAIVPFTGIKVWIVLMHLAPCPHGSIAFLIIGRG